MRDDTDVEKVNGNSKEILISNTVPTRKSNPSHAHNWQALGEKTDEKALKQEKATRRQPQNWSVLLLNNSLSIDKNRLILQ